MATAVAAQDPGEAGQLPQGTQAHPCTHRSPGPLSRGPAKTRPCTIILSGHLSRRKRQRQCQNLPPTQTSLHYTRPTRACAHTPKHRQGPPRNTDTPTSDPHAESKTLTASPTLCTDPPWVRLASEMLGPLSRAPSTSFLGAYPPLSRPHRPLLQRSEDRVQGDPSPGGGGTAMGGVPGAWDPWMVGGEGRVKVQMGGSAHTCRGSLASPHKRPPGANFYQLEPSGQGVGTHPAPAYPLHGPQSSGGGMRRVRRCSWEHLNSKRSSGVTNHMRVLLPGRPPPSPTTQASLTLPRCLADKD